MSKACDFIHLPVLAEETLFWLNIRADGCYVDCTLGGAGHAAAIAQQLGPKGQLIGIDQDADALKAAAERLDKLASPAGISLVEANFAELDVILSNRKIAAADGILADLGVSSWQLDQPERGFAYLQDGPLDMRMNQSSSLTAAELVNTWPQDRLADILFDYGEERYAGRISRAIVARRSQRPFNSTTDLAELVITAMPAASRREAQHPARRTFQALRIAVNDELKVLEQLLKIAPPLLQDGGRLCVITFHSLEDRLVKQAFQTLEKPCICPRDFPVCTCGRKPMGRVLTRRPIIATEEEKSANPRSRSAHLRCFERIVATDVNNKERSHVLH